MLRATRKTYRYAEFTCQSCGHSFPDRLPPLCADLPACPLCDGGSLIVAPLVQQGHTWAAQAVLGLVLLSGSYHHRLLRSPHTQPALRDIPALRVAA